MSKLKLYSQLARPFTPAPELGRTKARGMLANYTIAIPRGTPDGRSWSDIPWSLLSFGPAELESGAVVDSVHPSNQTIPLPDRCDLFSGSAFQVWNPLDPGPEESISSFGSVRSRSKAM